MCELSITNYLSNKATVKLSGLHCIFKMTLVLTCQFLKPIKHDSQSCFEKETEILFSVTPVP